MACSARARAGVKAWAPSLRREARARTSRVAKVR